MARYIALYCDKAIVPLKVFWPGLSKSSDASDRIALGGSLCSLVTLKPLIQAGLVVVVRQELHFCKTHWSEAVPGFEKILKTADSLADLNANKFSVYYEPHKTGVGGGFLNINGPEEYLEHGSANYMVNSVPKWLPKRSPGHRLRLPTATVRGRMLLSNIFRSMANDAILQTYFGRTYNARYVTDLPGEAEFFQLLNSGDSLAIRTATLCAHLTHSIPLLQNAPLETVLKVRREEPEAFANYRAALTGIVKNHVAKGGTVAKKEAKKIYEDILKASVLALQTKAKTFSRANLKNKKRRQDAGATK